MIGFSFDSEESAHEVWKYVERLISNPENIALSGPGRKRKTKRTKPIVLPPKSQISHPCQFLHVTKVNFNLLFLELRNINLNYSSKKGHSTRHSKIFQLAGLPTILHETTSGFLIPHAIRSRNYKKGRFKCD